MNNKILTIIIPVYNVEDYIYECLESLHNQTNQNFYTLFVDDCGTDKSIQIINEYLESGKLHNAKIIRRKKNGGLSAARNSGLKEANTDYVVFLDSDDFLDTRAVEVFVESIEKYHSDVLLFDDMKVPSNQIQENRLETGVINGNYKIRDSFCSHKILSTAWNKVVNRHFLEKKQIFFQEGIIHEDILWGWKLFSKAHTVARVKAITLYYRERNNSIMTSSFGRKNIDSLLVILKLMNNDLLLMNDRTLYGYFYSIWLEFVLKIYRCSSGIDYIYAYKKMQELNKEIPVASLSKASLMLNMILHYPKCISILLIKILLKTKFSYMQ
jgi:glycosyltransferase involved in cell wall biosynthesis